MQYETYPCMSGGWSGFGVGGFSSAFAWGATLVSTRYFGSQVSGAPTCVVPLLRLGGGRLCWCLEGGALVGG